MTTQQLTAADEYMKKFVTIGEQLETINDLVAQHQDNLDYESVHYGNVGDLAHVSEQLKQVISFLSGKGGE